MRLYIVPVGKDAPHARPATRPDTVQASAAGSTIKQDQLCRNKLLNKKDMVGGDIKLFVKKVPKIYIITFIFYLLA